MENTNTAENVAATEAVPAPAPAENKERKYHYTCSNPDCPVHRVPVGDNKDSNDPESDNEDSNSNPFTRSGLRAIPLDRPSDLVTLRQLLTGGGRPSNFTDNNVPRGRLNNLVEFIKQDVQSGNFSNVKKTLATIQSNFNNVNETWVAEILTDLRQFASAEATNAGAGTDKQVVLFLVVNTVGTLVDDWFVRRDASEKAKTAENRVSGGNSPQPKQPTA
jgi:hypothetical protein